MDEIWQLASFDQLPTIPFAIALLHLSHYKTIPKKFADAKVNTCGPVRRQSEAIGEEIGAAQEGRRHGRDPAAQQEGGSRLVELRARRDVLELEA